MDNARGRGRGRSQRRPFKKAFFLQAAPSPASAPRSGRGRGRGGGRPKKPCGGKASRANGLGVESHQLSAQPRKLPQTVSVRPPVGITGSKPYDSVKAQVMDSSSVEGASSDDLNSSIDNQQLSGRFKGQFTIGSSVSDAPERR